MLLYLCVIALFAGGNGTKYLSVVKAGSIQTGAVANIAELSLRRPPTVCVEQYPDGISIRCSGSDVLGDVRFFMNGRQVHTARIEPFFIAGFGLANGEVYPWTGFRSITALNDGTRRIRIECKHAAPNLGSTSFSGELIIAAAHCAGGGAPTSDQTPTTATLTAVEAGRAPFHDIATLSLDRPPTVCVENFDHGISIRCGGSDVMRSAVRFSVNRHRVKTESHPPYHIAGDNDAHGLAQIFSWIGFRSAPARSDGTRRVRITCEYRDLKRKVTSIEGDIIIDSPLCSLVNPVLFPGSDDDGSNNFADYGNVPLP